MTPSTDQLEVALRATGSLVAGVRPEQWSAPTPCADWDVRQLAGHLVGGNLRFAAALGADEPAPGDPLEPDPVTAYAESAAAVVAAFGQPGALQRMITVPAGTVPGHVALHLRITEALVHGWDVARATGQSVAFPEPVVEQELAFTERQLPTIPENRRPFGPPQPVADDAPVIDRLVALLGRTP